MKKTGVFPSAAEDISAAKRSPETAQTKSNAYRLAFADEEFLLRDELRPVRLHLELLKPDLIQADNEIHSTVVVFGSARVPDEETAKTNLQTAKEKADAMPEDNQVQREFAVARQILKNSIYYEETRKLAEIITLDTVAGGECDLVVVTGGGPGLMEAANRGALEAKGKSVGLNIVLPHEQYPNAYITPELSFQFHYFAIRKMHFLKRARALVACPGGFGTMDELFEALTLVQTKKIKPIPIILLGSQYWKRVIDFGFLVDEGMITGEDTALFQFADTAEEAWQKIKSHDQFEGGVCPPIR